MRNAARGAALAALLLAAGVDVQAAGLRIGLQSDPDALDPATGTSFTGRIVFAALCDKLIDIDEKIEFVPQLARSWAWSPDGLTLTFRLRDDVVFHDGERFDAQAAKINLERYRNAAESRRKAELKPVAAIEATDATTLILRLSEPSAPLLAVLADRAGMMMSPKALAEAGPRIAANPVCSGPFKFARRVPLERIVLDRFDRYWNAAAVHVDSVTFTMIPDNSVRLVNLRAGQLDLVERIAPSDVKTVRSDARLKLATVTGLAYQSILINVGHGEKAAGPLGRSAKVREAFEAALDRGIINQVALEGLFIANNQPEAPGSTYHFADLVPPARNPAAARALLRAAGHERFAFTLKVSNLPVESQVAQIIQAMAAEGGFDIRIEQMESSAMVAATQRGDYDAAIAIWSGRPDPDGNVAIWLASDGFLNWGRYASGPVDAALAAARRSNDTATRQAQYRLAAAAWMADRPHLFLYHHRWFWGLRAGLEGFVPSPDGIIRFAGLRPAASAPSRP